MEFEIDNIELPKLEDCPFCGNKARFVVNRFLSHTDKIQEVFVNCSDNNCGARLSPICITTASHREIKESDYSYFEEAAKVWNKRYFEFTINNNNFDAIIKGRKRCQT